jgi:hypothetical protein
MKTLREIRDELLEAYLELENSYIEDPGTEGEDKIAHVEIQLCEALLNAIKNVEYHYKEDVLEMRTKKRWHENLKKANKLFLKYGELKNPEDPYSEIKLQNKFDSSGFLENLDFILDAANRRATLKRKR